MANTIIYIVGDSIMVGIGSGYILPEHLDLGPNVTIDNRLSRSGATLAQVDQDIIDLGGLASLFPSNTKVHFHFQRGTNDVPVRDADVAYSYASATINNILLFGGTVSFGTPLPRSDSLFDGKYQNYLAYYNLVRGNKAGAIRILDLSSIPNLTNPDDTAYYSDKLHPTQLGQLTLKPYYEALFAEVLLPLYDKNLRLDGNPIFTTGKFGQCLAPGTGATRIYSDVKFPSPGSRLEMWAKFPMPDDIKIVAGIGRLFWIGAKSDGYAYLSVRTQNGLIDAPSTVSVGDNLWHYWCLNVKEDGTFSLRIDNVEAVTNLAFYDDGSAYGDAIEFCRYNGRQFMLGGPVDNIALFDHIHEGAAPSQEYTNETGLEAYYKLNGNARIFAATAFEINGPTSLQAGDVATYVITPNGPMLGRSATITTALTGPFTVLSPSSGTISDSLSSFSISGLLTSGGTGTIDINNNIDLTNPNTVTVNVISEDPILGVVTVPDDRLAVVSMTPTTVSNLGLATNLPSTWRAPLDPSDITLYAVDFKNVLSGAEINTIEEISISELAAGLGLEVIGVGSRRPIIDRNNGRIGIWIKGDPTKKNNVEFSAGGIWLGVTVRISTNTDPSSIYERTFTVNVRQL